MRKLFLVLSVWLLSDVAVSAAPGVGALRKIAGCSQRTTVVRSSRDV